MDASTYCPAVSLTSRISDQFKFDGCSVPLNRCGANELSRLVGLSLFKDLIPWIFIVTHHTSSEARLYYKPLGKYRLWSCHN
ncbi:hypothetical protein NPIL_296951 [Nephila pilipes]|uniref:Uncharacterized protein n=1 Tax=Nephila pilipes TaxID=299642 RepID=A0A8X6PW05_NEPPI|nr:hypothetical protein NPIL_296951 [Nephila pilipes]